MALTEFKVGRISTIRDVFVALTEIERLFNSVIRFLQEEPWGQEEVEVLMSMIGSGSLLSGDAIQLPVSLDAAQDGENVRVTFRAVVDEGTKTGDFSLNGALGSAHNVTLGDSCTLLGIDGLSGPEPMSLFVVLGGHTLTLDPSVFVGPRVSFVGEYAAISFVSFGSGFIVAMGNDW